MQGSPDYDPDDLTAKKGDEITVVNQDTVPHTATSGTGPTDPNSGKLFDTSIINPSESGKISLAQVDPGQYDFHCTLHPYMTGKMTVGAAAAGGGGGVLLAAVIKQEAELLLAAVIKQEEKLLLAAVIKQKDGELAAGGVTLNILEGAAVQGSPDYDPDDLTAKKGDEITVVNQDTVPHTATSGTGPTDPNSGKLFDTSIINPSESGKISLAQVDPGQYDFHCTLHPYMTGKMTVG